MPANLENSTVATGLEKVSVHSNPKEKEIPKNAQPTTQFHLSHTLTVMLKILQARLQQYVNCDFQLFRLHLEKADQAAFRKSRGTRHQITAIWKR